MESIVDVSDKRRIVSLIGMDLKMLQHACTSISIS